jgi:WD40 repeat protein
VPAAKRQHALVHVSSNPNGRKGMASIFLSHSSHNDDRADEIKRWLAANGWDDVFLDRDPERGIVAGQRWKEALQKAAHQCEVVVALISPEWLASAWCKAEIDAARLMGKKVIVALIGVDKSKVPLELADEQWVDLDGDPDARTRLKEGLKRAGLDPSSFPFEEGRRPYPGFAFLEEKDAAIFFGRDAQIVRGLDAMRGLVRAGVERMLVILGASGSGKSSFLRAGLWPRLKRDQRTWLPLPIIRPERAVISGKFGLTQSLHQVISEPAFADEFRKRALPRSRAAIQEFIETEDGLLNILSALRAIAQASGVSGEIVSPPTIVLAVDQGEELFNEEGRAEAKRFVDILIRMKVDPGTLFLFAMRSDAFPQLQTDPSLAQLSKATFTLDMMLEGSYRAVIEGPAQLVKPNPLRIDPQLTDALLEDLSGQDALPLLAFTLAYLYEQYAVDNRLDLPGYNKLGRLAGVIDATVREAFAQGSAQGELPNDAKAQIALARAAFIPHLARVNAAGQFVRRVATRDEIPVEARPLIDRFAERRLLIRDRRKIAGQETEVIEVAHEALLREWRELHEALVEEREFLASKGQLEQDVAEWRAASERRKAGALLSGNKLLRARDWLAARPQDLFPEERQFIEASSQHEFRQVRRKRLAAGVAFILISIFAIAALVFGFDAWRKRDEASEALKVADHQREEALKAQAETVRERDAAEERLKEAQIAQSRFLAKLSDEKTTGGDTTAGILLALEALPHEPVDKRPIVADARLALTQATLDARERLVLQHRASVLAGSVLAFSPDGRLLATGDRLWDAQSGQERSAFEKGENAAFLPSGLLLVAGSSDNGTRLREVQTGRDRAVLPGPGRTVAFSSDGRSLATFSLDDVRLWDAQTGHQRAVLRGVQWIDAVVFSPDGRLVATGARDGTARLWDAQSGHPRTVLPDAGGALAFSRDGLLLASGARDGTLKVWEAHTGKKRAILRDEGPIVTVAFSPDGRLLAAVGLRDNNVRIWNVSQQQRIVLRGHKDVVNAFAFTSDGRLLATVSDDNTVRLWDPQNGEERAVLRGHETAVNALVISTNGRLVATQSSDSTRIWDVRRNHEYAIFRAHEHTVNTLAFSKDGRLLATAGFRDNTVRLWEVQNEQRSTVLRHEGAVNALALSPNGRVLASGSDDKTVRLWETQTAKEGPMLRHEYPVDVLAFSPDSGLLATSGLRNNTVRLWEVQTGRERQALRGHEKAIRALSFSPDGQLLATGSDDQTVRLWDAQTGKENVVLPLANAEAVRALAYSPDGRMLATGGLNGFASLWDAQNAQETALRGHEEDVKTLAFSPDGRLLATGSDDKTVRLWEVRTGRERAVLRHDDAVNALALSPDGRLLATGALDGSGRLWDTETAQQLAVLRGHDDAIRALAFSPDGRLLASGSDDNTARLSTIPPSEISELVEYARKVLPVGRTKLTPDERAKAFLKAG